MFFKNKWGNKEYIIINDSAIKGVGLKVQAPIKKSVTLLWNGNKPDK
jgi:hypothetical protein